MPTSSNPPIPSSDFQPFRPIPLFPSTAFKRKSQVQQGLKLCLLILFVQQPHPYHLSAVSLDPWVSPACLPAAGLGRTLPLHPSADATPGTQDLSLGNLNPPHLPDDMSDQEALDLGAAHKSQLSIAVLLAVLLGLQPLSLLHHQLIAVVIAREN